MGVELDVWAEHKINFGSLAEAIDFIETKLEKKIEDIGNLPKKKVKETSQVEDIQYFADFETLQGNFRYRKRIELNTNFAFCHRILIYPQTINFWGKGFYTRDTRWMELIRKDFSNELHWNEIVAKEFTNNWSQFRSYCQETTQKLGGDKIIYVRDNFKMLDKFFAGESLQSGIEHELATGISEYYELDLVEHFPEDFKHKYVWFYEKLNQDSN
ncbi:MAG: hypothetical protein AAB336_02255 [Acidobacteriota bacterium]